MHYLIIIFEQGNILESISSHGDVDGHFLVVLAVQVFKHNHSIYFILLDLIVVNLPISP